MAFSVFGLLALLPTVFAVQQNYTFNLVNTVLAPDGFERSTVTNNGIFPGTLITANAGDSLFIETNNQLSDPTMRRSSSIHWHGLFQARSSGMDGPAFVNQCPIAPNSTFNYQFDLANQTGSFWYHSHLSTQYCDGLRGSLIIYDPNDPLKDLYDVDDESTIITLADWYHDPAPDAQKIFFETGVVPIPDTGLINGVGRYQGGPEVPYAVITVQQGKRYRFRLIQIACRPFFTFSIDQHNLTVMELDGVEHDPLTFQNVDIYVAQRLSVIVNASQPVDNYWIRAPLTGGAPGPTGNPNLNNSLIKAILRYEGAPDEEPTTIDDNGNGTKLVDALMHPIAQAGPGILGTGPPDFAITLNISQPNPPYWDINGISYISPTLPLLLQLLSGASSPFDFMPSNQVNVLPSNSIIEVSIPGTGAHPFHLHGHTMDVIRETNNDTVNLINPPRRDVVPINGGNTTFRFFSGNPGAWFLHCHIDWHLEAGLAVVFAESPELNINGNQSQILQPDWLALCPEYDALEPEFQ